MKAVYATSLLAAGLAAANPVPKTMEVREAVLEYYHVSDFTTYCTPNPNNSMVCAGFDYSFTVAYGGTDFNPTAKEPHFLTTCKGTIQGGWFKCADPAIQVEAVHGPVPVTTQSPVTFKLLILHSFANTNLVGVYVSPLSESYPPKISQFDAAVSGSLAIGLPSDS
jgi:hypothetical protein